MAHSEALFLVHALHKSILSFIARYWSLTLATIPLLPFSSPSTFSLFIHRLLAFIFLLPPSSSSSITSYVWLSSFPLPLPRSLLPLFYSSTVICYYLEQHHVSATIIIAQAEGYRFAGNKKGSLRASTEPLGNNWADSNPSVPAFCQTQKLDDTRHDARTNETPLLSSDIISEKNESESQKDAHLENAVTWLYFNTNHKIFFFFQKISILVHRYWNLYTCAAWLYL